MIRIEGIAAFVATVEHGSISGAARQLRLSKSVVSERLAELERSLGSALLHRTTRKLSLTEDGTTFLPRAQRIIRDVTEAAADIAERRGTLAGPLRIAAPVTFGHMHLGPALYPFLKSHPEIRLTLDLDDRRIDVASSGHDAIIRQGVIDDTRLVVWKLAKSRRLLVSSAAYLAEHGTPACIQDLRDHRGIFYTNRGASDWHFRTEDGPVTIQARQALGVNNGDMIRDAVAAGLGIAMLPAFIAGPAIRAGTLAAIPLDIAPDEEWIYMAHSQGRDPSAKLRALRDHLKETFGDPPYWEVQTHPIDRTRN